jgi:hypothetical protein
MSIQCRECEQDRDRLASSLRSIIAEIDAKEDDIGGAIETARHMREERLGLQREIARLTSALQYAGARARAAEQKCAELNEAYEALKSEYLAANQYRDSVERLERKCAELAAALNVETTCQTCDGTGIMCDSCPQCDCLGYVSSNCGACGGKGSWEEQCAECDGRKRSFRSKDVDAGEYQPILARAISSAKADALCHLLAESVLGCWNDAQTWYDKAHEQADEYRKAGGGA